MPITKVSREILNRIAKQLQAQSEKGLREYGVTIDDASDDQYNWSEEALAEVIDASQYLVKENMRLRRENAGLRANEQRGILLAQMREEKCTCK
ncbi:hypothetical protein [Halalkalibacter krulwichiae]|uniref:Uncharacterized protein n=1 Tax=Halalkalibacter krulwichiae TaxID=199441 RepID=A0A1X9ME91_9BACI|nr:hypothetical protein [Halalkalibacter krulwichiae]ARK28752.1 hypothetical protein BkAM31D_02195 [Halalkalibacter krulwichiae]